MIRPFLAALGAAMLFAAAACDDGRSYPSDRGDGEYNLQAMMLTDGDMPRGITRTDERAFDNEEWSQVFDVEDPEIARTTLEGQSRIGSYIAFFTWEAPQEHFGTVISITSQSTLYKDEEAAGKALNENRFSACGLLVSEEETGRAEIFYVPRIGDESLGMFITQQQSELGISVDTILCFRTGRVVHAVVQTGLDGTQDVALAVKLAQRMLARVDAAFDGKAPPSPTPGAETTTPAPETSPTPTPTPTGG